MSNTLLNADIILNEALRILHNKCAFVSNIDKQHDKKTTIGGFKTGGSIRIRKPNQFTVRTGWTINVQDTVEESETLTIGTVKGVDLAVTDAELSLNIHDFSQQFITPAVSRLASEIDLLVYEGSIPYVWNQVGTAGTTPAALQTYLDAGRVLTDFITPKEARKMVINPAANAAVAGVHTALFNPQSKISTIYTEGQIAQALGFNWFETQNVPTLTTGSRGGTILIDDSGAAFAVEGGTTIHVDGLTNATDTWAAGDVFTVAAVYAVNPETKQTLPDLQQFVVTTAAVAASNEVDLTVRPKMYTSASGALQTISAFPIDEAVVTVVGTASTGYPINIAFHPEFCTFATANLEMPSDVNYKAQKSLDGINMRILRQYDINNARYPLRMDVFYGFVVQRDVFACRIIG